MEREYLEHEEFLTEQNGAALQDMDTSAAVSYTLNYNPNSAVAYARLFALTHNTEHFTTLNTDCASFASQCVWAGFGGSNNNVNTDLVYPMHSSESLGDTKNKWYHKKTTSQYSLPWRGTLSIWDYATIQNGNSSSLSSTINRWESTQVACTLNAMPTMDYAGSIIIGGQGSQGDYAHAVFAVAGTNKSTIRVCAHSGNAYCVPLSYYENASAPYTWAYNEPLHIIKPTRYIFTKTVAYGAVNYRNNYIYGSVGASLLHSGADVTGTAMYSTNVQIMKEGQSSPVHTYSISNSSYYSFYYTYSAAGRYNIVVKIKATASAAEQTYTSKALIE